ncbi:MAG: 1-deoxy-D-xylulose-5-phosphate synthase [Coriobacteriales bacterium]|nr:1-deoxy-D-xylulose-5-phosphate synthase [Coriobacteriales bacterium]
MTTRLDIPHPAELRGYDVGQLNALAVEIRRRLIEVTSKNGGHLASSLGAVEIILALHAVYNLPVDQLVFDVGHQSYAHKLLTGRDALFSTLRTYGGLAGFTRREESPYDTHDSGHASDSLSIALGLALARDLRKGNEQVVALIGDAALSGGMAFEALNQIGQEGTRLVIVLNDNEMSISRNVGALSLYLAKARMGKLYTTLRDTVEDRLGSTGRFGRLLVNAGEAAKGSVKKLVVPGTIFEDIGITYIGPLDGHNIGALKEALSAARRASGPILLHAVTQKGRGYAPAEHRPDVFHGVGCYDPATGEFEVEEGRSPTFTAVFSTALLREAEHNEDIVAITAAMTDGTGLAPFCARYPERFFDVGIAEEHAVALAAGLALGGKIPVVAIYSTFLQRGFDQLMIDVALQKQHVVFCVDRAGLVGEDGTTHHGLFDLAYLRQIPGMKIIAPADAEQLADALHTALTLDGPVAIRYPRGETPRRALRSVADSSKGDGGGGEVEGAKGAGEAVQAEASAQAEEAVQAEEAAQAGEAHPALLVPGKATRLRAGKDVSLLALGRMVPQALEAAELLAERGIEAAVYDMLWVKPLDVAAVCEAARAPLVVTLEEGTIAGGFGSAVLEALAHAMTTDFSLAPRLAPRVLTLGIPDEFVTHGSVACLFAELGLDAPRLAARIQDVLDGAATS